MKKVRIIVPYSSYVGYTYAKGDKPRPVAQQGYSAWVTQILFTDYAKLMGWRYGKT